MKDKCETCGAEYRHIQAPHKPPGVIMMSLCDCVYEYTTQGATTIVTSRAPTDDERAAKKKQ